MLCFPVLALGGEIVIMRAPDVGGFLGLVERHRVTHTFLPPTLIYMVLGHEALDATDLGSLQCFWYGAAPMSAARLEEAITRIGPVMAQLFGQTEAPMMISMMPPADHVDADGSAGARAAVVGRPAGAAGAGGDPRRGGPRAVPGGERGEICVRSSLVMAGYYKNPEATAEAGRYGWHHTGDIGYLDADGFLHIVDRAKDMIITGGFNVYSTEVEQALLAHPDVQDCAVIGVPDEKWGERVVAVVQPYAGRSADAGRRTRVRAGADRRGEGAEAGAGLGGPAPLEGRQGAQDRHPLERAGLTRRRVTCRPRLRRARPATRPGAAPSGRCGSAWGSARSARPGRR